LARLAFGARGSESLIRESREPSSIPIALIRGSNFGSQPGASLFPGRILTVPPSGGWKAARTRTLESVRYVAQPFQAAGSRSFPAPQRTPARVGPWWEYQDALLFPAV